MNEEGNEKVFNDSATGTVDLIGHNVLGDFAFFEPEYITNLIYISEHDEAKWIEDTTKHIPVVRALSRSTYFQWAMAINGLHIAQEKYNSKEWKKTRRKFVIRSQFPTGMKNMVEWSGPRAADAHIKTVNKMAAWGYIELYAVLEKSILDFYEIYIDHHPNILLRGADNKDIRALQRKARDGNQSDKNKWTEAWNAKKDKWRKRKLYNGLHKVLLGYINASGLEKPSGYKRDVNTWGKTLEAIGMIRHLLVHGAAEYTKELEDLCKLPYIQFPCREGDTIEMSTQHLQSILLFTEQLWDALNISLMEKAYSMDGPK